MKIAAGLPAMPRLYIIDTPAPNAFATGRKPERSTIAVTAGLLTRLNRDELQGVVAHEMSHITNRDILFMTFAGVMLGSITLLSHSFLRGSMYGRRGTSRLRSGGSSKGSKGVPIIAVIAIVFAILAPLMAQLLYYAISRRREYLADASAVRLTRYPEGLASALEKISQSTDEIPAVNKINAALFIINPLKKKGARPLDLTGTHPPISERIRILRAMMRGSNLSHYDKAYREITGAGAGVIPVVELGKDKPISIRKATDMAEKTEKAQDKKTTTRELNDLMRAVNKYVFLACTCGLNIKLPPDFKKKEFSCPRCKRTLKVPVAELAAAATIAEGIQAMNPNAEAKKMQPEMTYRRKRTGWESFKCICGKQYQLSPTFQEGEIACSQCGRMMKIENA